jgi:hypothetical protein
MPEEHPSSAAIGRRMFPSASRLVQPLLVTGLRAGQLERKPVTVRRKCGAERIVSARDYELERAIGDRSQVPCLSGRSIGCAERYQLDTAPERKRLISAAWTRAPTDRPAASRSPSTRVAEGYSFVLTYHKP